MTDRVLSIQLVVQLEIRVITQLNNSALNKMTDRTVFIKIEVHYLVQ